jgi:hypothetical protein
MAHSFVFYYFSKKGFSPVIRGPLWVPPTTSASCTESYNGASPSHMPGNSFETSTRACVATTRRRAPSWTTRSARASIGSPWSLMPTRPCARARGANFMHAKPTSQLTPYRPYPSHMVVRRVGVGHRRAPTKGARGLHPPAGCRRQVLQMDRGTPNHKSQSRADHVLFHGHHPPVWGAELHHHRQWLPVYWQKVPRVLRRPPHPWTGRSLHIHRPMAK